MAKKSTVKITGLADAITKDLTLYTKEVQDKINKAGRRAIKEVERKTKDTAPFNARAYHRHFVDQIATRTDKSRTGDETHVWYVKPPAHRLTHLLVHGHETKDGGRAGGSSFLRDALDDALRDYEKEVEEAIRNG